MKDYTYAVFLVTHKGGHEPILQGCKSPWKARHVALRVKVKPGRRDVYITRDNKKLPGGQSGLDVTCLALWLEEHQPEEGTPWWITTPKK